MAFSETLLSHGHVEAGIRRPTARDPRSLGDKVARVRSREVNVPILSVAMAVRAIDEAKKIAEQLGYP
jgi:biotin carboxylase